MLQRRGKSFGVWGENQAALFLTRHGFSIVERNFYTPVGEIDIVAKKNDDYYFVEVKTRRSGELATDLAVTYAKKIKLLKTIKRYCYKKHIADVGIVPASLLIVTDKIKKVVQFRLAVLY